MADFTLVGPGNTQNPWPAPGVLVMTGTLRSDTNGWRAGSAGTFAAYAHNATYGSTIVVSCTIGAGAGSNGDQVYLGPAVRSNTNGNESAGLGLFIDAFVVAPGYWDPTGVTFTKVSASDTSITRANGDVFTAMINIVSGVATITATQNGVNLPFTGPGGGNFTSQYTGEASLAGGASLFPGNNNSLYLSQFTSTGVMGGGLTITPNAGSETVTGNAPNVTPATNTVLTPFVARKESGLLVPDRRIHVPQRKIFLATFVRKAA